MQSAWLEPAEGEADPELIGGHLMKEVLREVIREVIREADPELIGGHLMKEVIGGHSEATRRP